MKKKLLSLLLIVCFVMAIPCQASATNTISGDNNGQEIVTQQKKATSMASVSASQTVTMHKPGISIYSKLTDDCPSSLCHTYTSSEHSWARGKWARGSLGYRAYMVVNGKRKYGFVTCAHGLDYSADGKVYTGSFNGGPEILIGTIVKNGMKSAYGSNVMDYTFVELLPGHDISDYTVSGKKLTGIGTPVYGLQIYKEGCKTGLTQATVDNEYKNVIFPEYPSKTFINCFDTKTAKNPFTGNRDSGGVIYSSDGKVIGVICAETIDPIGKGYYASGTRADKIQNEGVYVAHGLNAIKLSVTNNPSTGKVKLFWTNLSNVKYYYIYRREVGKEQYTLAKTTRLTECEINPPVDNSKVYEYMICAERYDYAISYSNPVKACARFKVYVNKTSSGRPKLTWDSAGGANEYDVYYSTEITGKYTLLKGEITKKEYTHDEAKGNKEYYYRIKANSNNGYAPSYSSLVSCTRTYAKPTGVVAVRASNGRPKLTWKSVTDATKYYVYRSTKKSSGYKNIATVTSGTSYSDNSDLNIGTTYYYKVRVANSDSAPYSEVVYCQCKHAKPSWRKDIAFSTGGKPKLEWNSVSGVSNYDVYYSTDNKNFKLLKSVKGTSYTHGDAKPGCKYYYKIKVSGSTGSDFSSVKSCRSN